MRSTRVWIAATPLLLFLSGCGAGSPGQDAFATQVAKEIFATQTATWGDSLRPDNASQLVELARFTGDPVVHVAADASGEALAYTTVSGIHLVDALSFEERRFVPTTDWLDTFAISPDGRFMAGSTRTGVTLWSTAEPSEQASLEVAAPNALAFSPDGEILVALDWDTLTAVQVPSGSKLYSLPELYDANTFAFVPGKGEIAVPQVFTEMEAEILLFDTESGLTEGRWELGEPAGEAIDCLAFSEDGSQFVLGWDSAPAEVWSAGGDEPVRRTVLPEETTDTRQASFLSEGRLILTTWSGKVQVWDLNTSSLAQGWGGNTLTLSESPEQAVIASRAGIQSRDLATGEVLRSIPVDSILALALFPDGRRIALGRSDGKVEIWDRGGSAVVSTFDSGLEGIRYLGFSPLGNYLMAVSPEESVAMWRVGEGQDLPLPPGSGWPSFAPDEKHFVTRGDDPLQLVVWETATGSVLHRLTHAAKVTDFRLSPSGELLASRIDDGSIWFWDIREGKFQRSLDDYLEWGGLFQGFSQDGRLLATLGEGNTLKIWNVDDATLVYEQQFENPLEYVELSPDFSLVLVEEQGSGAAYLWRPAEDVLAPEEPGLGPFSPDGMYFLHDSWGEVEVEGESRFEHALKIRQTRDGEVVQSIPDPGWSPDFSPNGSVIILQYAACATGEDCPSVRFFSVATGEQVHELANLDDYLSLLQQAQTGTTMAGMTRSGTVYVWGIP